MIRLELKLGVSQFEFSLFASINKPTQFKSSSYDNNNMKYWFKPYQNVEILLNFLYHQDFMEYKTCTELKKLFKSFENVKIRSKFSHTVETDRNIKWGWRKMRYRREEDGKDKTC